MRRIDRRCERIVFSRREKRPVLAVRRVGDPLSAQRMPPQMRVRRKCVAARRRGGVESFDWMTRVENEYAAVGLDERALEHHGVWSVSPTASSGLTTGAGSGALPRVAR